jgi:hypothetical protein
MSAPRMDVPLDSLAGRPLTIRFDWDRDWCGAVCPELEASGFGATPREAIEAVMRSIESTLKVSKANAPAEAPAAASRLGSVVGQDETKGV